MKLSACMIARNAAADIRKALQSLRGVVDESIVVDTGSTDETAQIAAACGARVYPFAWRDDFSAAKNFALSKAQGDWIIFLDADEYFAPGHGKALRRMLEECGDAEALLVKMVNIDADEGDAYLDAFYTARVFRRNPEIFYQGRIHEQICRADGRALRVRKAAETELLLYHTGYSTGRLREKARRNLRILQAELRKGAPPQPLYAYLAECYAALDAQEEALRYAKLDMAQGRRSVTYASRSYRVAIEALKALGGDPAELERALRQSMQAFPEIPDFSAEYALLRYRQKRYGEAQSYLTQAMQLHATYDGTEPSVFGRSLEIAERLLAELQTILQREKKSVKLSACVIVKNEAKHLPRWLASMERCADERIVVDTGSTDQSKDLAQAAGARVCEFAWTGDFSAAKNFAKAQARGEWIVFLDADEFFAETVTRQTLCDAVAEAEAAGADAILCTIVNVDADQGDRLLSRFVNIRMLRNDASLAYRWNVHENLCSERGELKTHLRRDIEIFHTGYSSGRMRQKQQRNLALLLKEIEKNGEQNRHYAYLSECYFGLEDYEKAIHYARLHLRSGLVSLGSDSAVYKTLAGALALTHAPEAEVQYVLQEAMAKFPQVAEFQAQCGESLWRQEHYAEAKQYFLTALEMERSPKTEEIDQFAALCDYVYERLGELALMEEDKLQAKRHFEEALRQRKYNADALRWLLLLAETDADKEALLDSLYEKNRRDMGFLLDVLEQTEIGAVYFRYAKAYAALDSEAEERADAYRRFASGEIEAASQAAMQILPVRLQNYVAAYFFALESEPALRRAPLPAALERIVCRYAGGAPLETADYAAYRALLPAILRYEGSTVAKRYLEIGLDFRGAPLLEIAQTLLKRESYKEAAAFYARACEAGDVLTADERCKAGAAQFAAGDFAAARRQFMAARAMGDTRREIDAYLAWLEEKV